jgi:hypothetical protein
MDDALGDALVVEMGDLLAQHQVFEQGRSAHAGAQRVLIVGDREALVGGKAAVDVGRRLMGLAADGR